MGSFRFIEYTGDDSGDVLRGLLVSDDDDKIQTVDARSNTVIGFTREEDYDEEEDDEDAD